MYSRSTGEVNSNRVTSSLLRKRTRLPTHAHEVRALTFEVTDNFGSNDALPCGAYGPWMGEGRRKYRIRRRRTTNSQALTKRQRHEKSTCAVAMPTTPWLRQSGGRSVTVASIWLSQVLLHHACCFNPSIGSRCCGTCTQHAEDSSFRFLF